jgi:hypothetical protein
MVQQLVVGLTINAVLEIASVAAQNFETLRHRVQALGCQAFLGSTVRKWIV